MRKPHDDDSTPLSAENLELSDRQRKVYNILNQQNSKPLSTMYLDAILLRNNSSLNHRDSLISLLFGNILEQLPLSFGISVSNGSKSDEMVHNLYKSWQKCLQTPCTLFNKYNEDKIKWYLELCSEYFGDEKSPSEKRKEYKIEQDKNLLDALNPKFACLTESLQEEMVRSLHASRRIIQDVKHASNKHDLDDAIYNIEQILIDSAVPQSFDSEIEIDKLILEVERAE